MIKISIIIVLTLLLSACGSSDKSEASSDVKTSKESHKTVKACDVLTDNYIKSTFKDSIEVKKMNSNSLGFCGYTFESNNQKHNVQLAFILTKSTQMTDEDLNSQFKRHLSYSPDSSPIDDIGEEAYYSNKTGVIFAKEGGKVISLQYYIEKSDIANWKTSSIKITKDMLQILAKNIHK